MTFQELLNICIFATVGVFAIAFLLDFSSMMISCWKKVNTKEGLKSAPEITPEPMSEERTEAMATLEWVKPVEKEPVEDVVIDVIDIAKTKAVITVEQLAELPIPTLKAIAKSKNINLGNCKKPTAIAKNLGIVTRKEVQATT